MGHAHESAMNRLLGNNRFRAALKAGVVYFGLVFGAGFILGPIRILAVVRRFGERVAELMEAPLMLIVIVLTARLVIRRMVPGATFGERLAVGLLGLALGLVFEFTFVSGLRGLTPADYFRQRDPVAGAVYYLILGLFSIMPILVERKARMTL